VSSAEAVQDHQTPDDLDNDYRTKSEKKHMWFQTLDQRKENFTVVRLNKSFYLLVSQNKAIT